MGKSGKNKKQKNKSKRPEDNENRPSCTEISQPLLVDPTPQMQDVLQYDCGHIEAKLAHNSINILVYTVKFVLLQKNTEEGVTEGRIEFSYVPYVDGSITLEFSEMVLGSPGTSPTKNVLNTVPLDVEQGLNEKLMRVPIKFPKRTTHLKYPYKVEIKTEAKEGGINCQLIQAVFERVNGELQISVTDKILWLNGRVFISHDSFGIFKALNIDNKKSDQKCGTCLISDNPGARDPIDNISVKEEIGRGSHTIVFNGTFQDQHCAVKRHSVTNKKAADNDIKMMKDIGSHSNIVSYFSMAETVKYVLVAMEMCKCSLNKLIASRVFENGEYKLTLEGFEDLVLWKCRKDPPEDPCKVYPSEHLVKFVRGIVCGLCRLHSRNISHNNLKSQNVLISRDTTVVDIIPKLSNFSRSSTLGTTGSGSLRGQERTFDRDLYDLGNLILDCITITHDRKAMSKMTKKINWVKHLPEAHDLITQLQNRDPKLRPTSAQVKMHPFLWGPKERLDFLYYASDCIWEEKHGSEIREPIFQHKDYKGWDKKIDDGELLKEIKAEYQSYHGVNLLRVIRNKYGHHGSLPKKLQSELGETLTEFDEYFSSRFPNLLMLVHNLFKDNPVNGKNLLDEYFKPGKI